MCGIAGWVGFEVADSSGAIEAMVAALAHRGPDDRGFWLGERAALGMSRLSVIDIDGGHQPKEARGWQVVLNGEIYNYRELRSELVRDGARFASDSDSEVVAWAVASWGESAFERFDGMYAVAAYNPDQQRLLVARDRFGEKPLNLWKRGTGLAFASEISALAPLGPMPPVDRDSVVEYLSLGYLPAPRAIFEEVEKLPPGHHGSFFEGRLSVQRTQRRVEHSPREPEDLSTEPRCGSLVDALDRRLRLAVESRLIADVEVGVLLSGGIDSSLVAAHAAAAHPGIHTFSVGVDDPRRDESAHARRVAEELHTTHHEIRVGASEALSVVSDLAKVYDEPFADASAIPTLLLSRFVSEHVKVALSGDGGDELFSGYRRYADVRSVGRFERAGRAVAPLARWLSWSWWARPRPPLRNLATTYGRRRQRFVEATACMPPALLRRLGVTDVFEAGTSQLGDLVAEAIGGAPDWWPELVDSRLYLPDDLLVKIDRASMSCGLEVRAPYLAPLVADWAMSDPVRRYGEPAAKTLPRDLARRYFGPAIADRAKQGFSVPLPAWLRGPLSPMLDAVEDGWLVSNAIVDRAGVRRLRRSLDRRFDPAAGPLWALAMFEAWSSEWL